MNKIGVYVCYIQIDFFLEIGYKYQINIFEHFCLSVCTDIALILTKLFLANSSCNWTQLKLLLFERSILWYLSSSNCT